MTVRSYLYVPGDNRDMLDGAPRRGADAVILDLEDAVAVGAKDRARGLVSGWIAERAAGATCEVWVRVNSGGRMAKDIAAVVRPGVTGIVLPKATASELDRAGDVLTRSERDAGMETGRIPLAALVESAAGLLELPAIAAHPRVSHLALGEADLTAELGLQPSPGEPELQPFRLDIVVVSAAAGIDPPVGSVSTDIRDLDALRVSTGQLRRLGFRSRSAIHPSQIDIINAAFTPTTAEVAEARELIERFDAAVQEGRGVITDDNGRMIDEAVVRSARGILERARLD